MYVILVVLTGSVRSKCVYTATFPRRSDGTGGTPQGIAFTVKRDFPP